MRYPDGSFDSPLWARRLVNPPWDHETVVDLELGLRVREHLDLLEDLEDVGFWADLAVIAGMERMENPGYCYRLALDTEWWENLPPDMRARMPERRPPGCAL